MYKLQRWTGISGLAVLFFILLVTGHGPGKPPGAIRDPGRPLRRYEAHPGPKYVPGQVVVRFKSGVSKTSIKGAHDAMRAQVLRSSRGVDGLEFVQLPPDLHVEEAIKTYRRNPDVLYAEPNYFVHALGEPNDPEFPSQWALNNIGQDGGAPDADIDAPEAWNITTGIEDVVVAVLDTGIDYTHADLAPNIFRNEADCNQNRVDDDHNGYIDDCYGIDVANSDSDPMDDMGHGTHVAGIIGAAGNNGLGVAGVNWSVKLLACKFLDEYGDGDVETVVTCLDYVAALKDRGVNIVATNNSWGGEWYSQALTDAINAHRERGILFIAAAGNEFNDADLWPSYPAGLYLPNVVSVAATGRDDSKATFSNYGRRTVHLGAPGLEILSTVPTDLYESYSGTSMAAPFVTGVAALLKAQDPTRDWRAIKNLILAGGDDILAMAPTITGKRLNAHGSLTCGNSTVATRLLPVRPTVSGSVGSPTDIAALNIDCATPNGEVRVQVSPPGDQVTLADDGQGNDQAAGDGIYSGRWTPSSLGSYTLAFPTGETANVQVLKNYAFSETQYNRRAFEGVNLDLSDDSVAEVSSPFPIQFGGGSFSELFISSNGNISFTDVFPEFSNRPLPIPYVRPISTLVAPFWDDLYPIPGTPQNVFWGVLGTAPDRELVVEWRDVRHFTCRSDPAATVTFQVVFFEGKSDIHFHYPDVIFGGDCLYEDRGSSSTVGILVSPDTASLWGSSVWAEQLLGDQSAIQWTLEGDAPPPNPVPVLTSLSPSSVEFGAPGFVLTLTGSNFVPASQVHWAILRRATRFISPTRLEAEIPASDLNMPYGQQVSIGVFNPPPGGGTSNYLHLAINNPVPTIAELSPASAVAGGLSFRLNVKGSGFTEDSFVRWNGTDRTVRFWSANLIEAAILRDDILAPGTALVTVFNRDPGGGLSNTMPFTIQAASGGGVLPGSSLEPSSPPPLLYLGPEDKRPPGALNPPSGFPPSHFRFLGWNYARRVGPEYLKRFSRPRGRPVIAARNPARTVNSTGPPSLKATSTAPPAAGFAFRESIPAGYLPSGVATGDFNRDGRMDWVVSNGGDNSLWVYLGRGDGTSELPTVIPLRGQSPIAVVAADLRGNGILDLVVA
jgi:subtilisin family serine protease